MRTFLAGPWPVAAIVGLLLVSLLLLSNATEDSARFGRLYSLLLLVNVAGVVALVALIAANLWRMVRQYRRRAPGSRLTARLVVMFTVLSVAPLAVVYSFSLQFLQRGIDTWFDVRVEQALEDALQLSRTSLEARMRDHLKQTEQLASEVTVTSGTLAALALDDLRDRVDASELTLLGQDGRILATSSAEPIQLVPNRPGEEVLLQLHQGRTYVGLDPIAGAGLHVRVVVALQDSDPGTELFLLQALYPMPERVNTLADSVQSAYAEYRELAFLRTPLKYSFTLTLSLVLLLSLLTAVLGAFYWARRMVAPVKDLAEGTQAVARGDYRKQLPVPGSDDIGLLVRSFNEMTRRIAEAQEQVQRSRRQAEGQRAYLETVLGNLSSGVLSVDKRHILRTANTAAGQILGADLRGCRGMPLAELATRYPPLSGFVQAVLPLLRRDSREWREEVTLFSGGQRQVLMCQGSALPGSGFVVVFDDITTLIQAQRNAAWAEVARRLAHEIKNPLTPIQLSAERLRHKYLRRMEPEEGDALDRLTRTIIQQVETMKEMVNAFSSYARSPALQPAPTDLNALVNDVLELYRGTDHRLVLETELAPELPAVEVDAGRLRQVLHNLVKNAEEAAGDGPAQVRVTTRCVTAGQHRHVQLEVTDRGPGIPEEILGQLFEPYVTTKPKGTGLGLAIVKKIVEEHAGLIWAENLAEGGVRFGIRLPLGGAPTDAAAPGGTHGGPAL